MKFIKKILKSKVAWTVIVLLLIGGAVAARFVFRQTPIEYATETVKRGSIIQTVTATGKVKSATDIQLSFKNPGTLSVVNVKVGNEVQSGAVLAQLRAGDLASNVERASAYVVQQQANLRKVKAGATSQDVAVYQATVDKAESDVATAKTDLENTEQTYRLALDNQRKAALNDIGSALTKANISLQKIYDTIYFEGDANNFTTSNSSLYQKVVSEYAKVTIAIDEAEFRYNGAKLSVIDTDISTALESTDIALRELSQNLSDLFKLFDYVIVTNALTQTDLATLKTTINTEQVTTNTSISTIATADDDIADAQLNYQTKVSAAANSVTTAEKLLAKAEADLNLRRAPSRPEDIALAEAQVLSAQADLQSARDQYNETILRAPITGVVTEVNYSVGEKTGTDPVVKMLAKEQYQIEVDIPESDIIKITTGQKADITLDAFSDSDIFTGIITTINPAQTEIQDVIYYRVTVTFSDAQPDAVKALVEKIKPGMTANVTVSTDRADDTLIIPMRAVKDVDGKQTVDVLENNIPRTVEVRLGLRGDDGQVQVISGLNEGQQVVTFVKNGN